MIMSKMKATIWMAVASTMVWGCDNKHVETAANTHDAVAHETHGGHEAHASQEGSEALVLNEGERWVVNEEMKPYVQAGSQLVEESLKETESDYVALADKLTEQNNELIKSCTMTGKSHEELHKWLHPHLGLVAQLREAPDKEAAEKLVLQLQESYQVYHAYFQ